MEIGPISLGSVKLRLTELASLKKKTKSFLSHTPFFFSEATKKAKLKKEDEV
jgi:hypothetical protein